MSYIQVAFEEINIKIRHADCELLVAKEGVRCKKCVSYRPALMTKHNSMHMR